MSSHEQKNLTVTEENFIEVPFMKIPIKLLNMEINPKAAVSLLTVYTVICRNKTIIGKSMFCFKLIYELYGKKESKTNRHKPKLYYNTLECLQYFESLKLIKADVDLNDSISVNDLVALKLEDRFTPNKYFINLRDDEFQLICKMSAENNIRIDYILKLFVYITDIIQTTKRKKFYVNSHTVAEKFNIKHNIVVKIIDLLCTDSEMYPAVFERHMYKNGIVSPYYLTKNKDYVKQLAEKKRKNYLAECAAKLSDSSSNSKTTTTNEFSDYHEIDFDDENDDRVDELEEIDILSELEERRNQKK